VIYSGEEDQIVIRGFPEDLKEFQRNGVIRETDGSQFKGCFSKDIAFD